MNPVAKFLIFHLKMSYQHTQMHPHKQTSLNIYSPRHLKKFDLRNNNKKVNFHTGLHSFEMLNIVFRQIEHFVARKSQLLTPFQEFVPTLMRLKLNMPLEDLAYGFNGILCRNVFSFHSERRLQLSLIVLKCSLIGPRTFLCGHKRFQPTNITTLSKFSLVSPRKEQFHLFLKVGVGEPLTSF